MSKVIKIFNPIDSLYGQLSNNSQHYMELGGKRYETVTNYIYSNLLTTSTYQTILREAKPKNVMNEYDKLRKRTEEDVTKKALDKALNVKFENRQLADALISTGISPILYMTNNNFLGSGPDNQGQNLYGKIISQIRLRLMGADKQKRNQSSDQERSNNVYTAYKANSVLDQALKDGNDLSEFIGLSLSDIVETSKGKMSFPPQSTVIQLVKRGNNDIVKYLDNPELLVLVKRKNGLRTLRNRLLREQKECVLKMYTRYLLEKNKDKYPNLKEEQYEQAVNQQLDKLDYQSKKKLTERVWNLYNVGQLSANLSDCIDQRLSENSVLSEEEVVKAENVDVTYKGKSSNNETNTPLYKHEQGQPVLIYPVSNKMSNPLYQQFSPVEYYGMLTIDGLNYPSVTHYILTALISAIPSVGGMKNAYKYILSNRTKGITGPQSFLNPDIITNRYNEIRKIDHDERLTTYAVKGLDKKFLDRRLQDLLVLTGKAELRWEDYSDPILGVGGKGTKGLNFVGTYLMKLRDKYTKEHSKETINKITESDVTKILENDLFLMNWVRMKVKDMCRTVKAVRKHLFVNYKIKVKINSEFCENVFNQIYNPCGALSSLSKSVNTNIPNYFRNMMSKCIDGKMDDDTVGVFWKRIVVMIYSFIKVLNTSSGKKGIFLNNMKHDLVSVSELLSRKTNCVRIVSDEYDNCIVSAIINLLTSIGNINKEDVNLAATLILGRDVDGEIKPEEEDEEVREQLEYRPIAEEDGGIDQFNEGDTSDEDYDPDDDPDDDLHSSFGGDGGVSSEDMLSVQDAIRNIVNEKADPREVAEYIFGAVRTIKNYNIDKNIKQNRINFFASM